MSVVGRRRRVLCGLLAAAVVGSGVVVQGWSGGDGAEADSVTSRKNDLDRQIGDLRESLEGASASLVEAAVSLRSSQAQLVDARAALATAQAQVAVAQRKDAELASRLTFATAQLGQAEAQIGVQQQATEDTEASIGRIAREAYMGASMGGLSVALQSNSAEQFIDRLAVAGAALRAQGSVIDELAVRQADLRARRAHLDAVQDQVAELKRQAAAVLQQRQAAQAAAAAAQASVQLLVTRQQAAVTTIQGQVAAEQARLNALQTEQNRLSAILAARARARELARRRAGGSSDGPPQASGGFLSYPANGPVTSGFGPRYHPILHIYRMHTGTDFGIGCGTPVYAAAPGEVISAGWAGGYGNRVVIDHGTVGSGDLATTYNHLTRIVVGGGRVARGQLIAYSGTTGLSTGCHLHFEALLDGSYVNPMRYL